MYIQRDRNTENQKHREAERQRDKTQRDRNTERQKHIETEKQRDRKNRET